MEQNAIAVARAFELAALGKYANLDDIRSRLAEEGFGFGHLTGNNLLAKIRKTMNQARNSYAFGPRGKKPPAQS